MPLQYMSQNRALVDKEICWKCFNEQFFPEVRKRTSLPVILLMDNAPGHFEEFKRHNVTVRLFSPNVTSWKQPCNLWIIGALKKKYKYLYLNDVLTFYTLNEASKNMDLDQSKQLRRAACVAHGQPENLFDAACYITEA